MQKLIVITLLTILGSGLVIAFIMYKLVIVLFTSIGGGAMAVLGIITLMLHVPAWQSAIESSLQSHERLLPLLVAVAAITGLVLQHSEIMGSGDKGDTEPKAA